MVLSAILFLYFIVLNAGPENWHLSGVLRGTSWGWGICSGLGDLENTLYREVLRVGPSDWVVKGKLPRRPWLDLLSSPRAFSLRLLQTCVPLWGTQFHSNGSAGQALAVSLLSHTGTRGIGTG